MAADVAAWGDGAAVADATSAAASGVLCKSNIGDNGGIAVVPPPALLVHASKANVTSAVLNAPVAVVVVSSGATVSCRRSVVGAAATDTVAAAVAVRAPPLSSRSPPPPPSFCWGKKGERWGWLDNRKDTFATSEDSNGTLRSTNRTGFRR